MTEKYFAHQSVTLKLFKPVIFCLFFWMYVPVVKSHLQACSGAFDPFAPMTCSAENASELALVAV